MNPVFFQQMETILAPERLDAYRQDGSAPATTLARYLLNLALCETLYSPLQFAEVALRNALHTCLTTRYGTAEWYEVAPALPAWQQKQLGEARQKLQAHGKPVTPGRMVAELQFGFWTGFFNKSHGGTGLGHALTSQAFAHAPRPERDMKKMDARWKRIRDLRNRVFHHERIIHWTDLDAQRSESGLARPSHFNPRATSATPSRFNANSTSAQPPPLSANGAAHTSPGQRPGSASSFHPALKGRSNRCLAPSGLGLFLSIEPRALPWAGLSRPFGAAEGGLGYGG